MPARSFNWVCVPTAAIANTKNHLDRFPKISVRLGDNNVKLFAIIKIAKITKNPGTGSLKPCESSFS